MNGIEVMRALGIPEEKHGIMLTGWGESFVSLPRQIEFLRADFIARVCKFIGISEETGKILIDAADFINQHEHLRAFAWHTYVRLISPSFSYGCHPRGFEAWDLSKSMAETAWCFPTLVALAALDLAANNYRAKNFPEELIRDTLSVYRYCDPKLKKTGRPGIHPKALNWIRIYISCRLLQFGRFNFKLMEAYPFGLVIRRKSDAHKIMLMKEASKCNSKGYVLQEDDPLATGGWSNILEETETAYIGHPVNPRGFARPETVSYAKSEWEVIASPGDIMIDMHIPAGGNMTPDACRDSFAKVFAYFKKFHPGKFKPVIFSHSWIFNTQFEEALPDSNLAFLMRQCLLFPHQSTGRDGMFFLFDDDYPKAEQWARLPRDTSVRKAMLNLLERGERLRCGGMLFFEEELPAFGQEPYRKMKE